MKRLIMLFTIVWSLTSQVFLPAETSGQVSRNGTPGAPAKPTPGKGGNAQKRLSEQECRTYAQAVIRAFQAADRAALDALMDWESILAKSTATLVMPESERQGVLRGMRKSLSGEKSLSAQWIAAAQNGANLDLVRIRESHGRQVVLMRLLLPPSEELPIYYELAPVRAPDGKVRADDIYGYLTGEFLTETLHGILLPVAANLSRTFIEKLVSGEQDFVRDLPKLKQAADLLHQGKADQTLALLNGMRPGTRKMRMTLMLRLSAAELISEQDYIAALDEYRKVFPDDPCLEARLIAYYRGKKECARALEYLDRLDRALGGDPYLNLSRAEIAAESGNLAEARRFARLAIDLGPRARTAYFSLVAMTLKQQNYEETLSLLKEIEQRFHIEFKDLNTISIYAGFVKSPQHRLWLEYLEQRRKSGKTEDTGSPARGGATQRPVTKPGSGH